MVQESGDRHHPDLHWGHAEREPAPTFMFDAARMRRSPSPGRASRELFARTSSLRYGFGRHASAG